MRLPAAGWLALPLLCAPLALRPAEDQAPNEGLFTFFAHDDLQSTFDFRLGRAGGRVESGEVFLDGAQLAFGVFAPDLLSFGFVFDENVEVLDLGEAYVAPQARARDGAEEFAIGIFHTLSFDGLRFSYVDAGGDVRPYDPADRILGALPPEGLRHVAPVVGHTYVVRVRRRGASREEFFKFQVVDLLPGHSLTIRWASLMVG